MTENDKNTAHETQPPVAQGRPPKPPARPDAKSSERLRWLIQLVGRPLLFLAAGILLIVGLGIAQKTGWITAGDGAGSHQQATPADEGTLYICPMMCTPPQSEPGRCPVCAMELVPLASDAGSTDRRSIQIDPESRRVANIQTVPVRSVPFSRRIRAIGELSYDEGTRKTIAAYVDSRLERLYADYTGVVVEKGDRLALLYSPQLYSSQVELLVAKRSQTRSTVRDAGPTQTPQQDLYSSARQRLAELGMTADQIDTLEQDGKANSRMHLVAPISGTVIEKLAVEGEYVKTGQPIYRLADLSTVWLMLELFPEDAAAIRYGQKVEAVVQSRPGTKFTGRVAFVDPVVNSKTRTVGVRVVVPNDSGLLRVGDYATATIDVRSTATGGLADAVYDPELADKWISPRHPQVIESSPGTCRICGIQLVPASRFGFSSQPTMNNEVLVVPRNAVLMAGQNSVVYVEAEPGRFQIRPVVLGPSLGDDIAVFQGVEEGEQVASSGNFLIDSQMQLAGNPSVIDPAKAGPKARQSAEKSPEVLAALAELPPDERMLAQQQEICPVTEMLLGSMGTPIKVDVDGTAVFICCEGCREELLENPARYLERLAARSSANASSGDPSEVEIPDLPDMEFSVPEVPDVKFAVPEVPDMSPTSEEIEQ